MKITGFIKSVFRCGLLLSLYFFASSLFLTLSSFSNDSEENNSIGVVVGNDDNDKEDAESQTADDDVSAIQKSESSGVADYNGHDYVDLGLSVKWATCNIGANSPTDVGSVYAWGETYTKKLYEPHTSVTTGTQMSNISGDKRYDAEAANWGGTWRMPTRTEALELVNRCDWTYGNINGVLSYNVTGPNGKSIFIPFPKGYATVGFWTSTPNAGYSNNSFKLSATKSGIMFSGGIGCFAATRSEGFYIRPVSK